MNNQKSSKKLTIKTMNPPSEEQLKKLIEHVSEFLRVKYYS